MGLTTPSLTDLHAHAGGDRVTLGTVVQHAAELIHPKSHAGTYGDLVRFPQLQRLARELVRAHTAGESTSVLHEIADELLDVMSVVRARRQAFAPAPSTRRALEQP